MPRLPLATDQGRVQTQALPGVRQSSVASPSTFAGPAQQAQEVGQALGSLADMQEKRSLLAMGEAETGALAEVSQLRQGALSQRGANAQGVSDKFAQGYDEIVAKHAADLNPDARTAFESRMAKRRIATLSSIQDYERQQTNAAVDQALQASQQATIDDAAANWTRPDLVATDQRQMEAAVLAQAQAQGWDTATADQRLGKMRTLFHKQVINARLDSDPTGAREYYQQHKDQIDGTARPVIEKALKAGGLRQRAQQKTDQIIASGTEDPVAAARAIKDPELRDEVVKRVKIRAAEAKAQLKAAQEKDVNQAWDIIAQQHNIDAIPSSLWSRLPGKTKRDLENEVAKGTDTDWPTYYNLKQIATSRPQEFAGLNLADYFGKLGGTERKELINLQLAARKGDKDTLVLASSKQQIINHAIANAGLDPKDATKPGTNGDKVRALMQRIDDDLIATQAATGKKASLRDIEDLANRMAVKVVTEKPYWFDTKTPAGLTQVEGVPEDLVPDLAARIKDVGQPVTAENIQKLYQAITQRSNNATSP